MTLVGVGHALADAFAFVDEDVPQTLGLHPGTYNRVPDYRIRAILLTLRQKTLVAGGSAANTVKLAARLGLDTHFVGQCGLDAAGQIFERELLEAGVKVALGRSDAPTGVCVSFLSPSQGRTVATFRSASGGLPLGIAGDTLLSAADVVVLEGYLLDEPEFLSHLLGRCAALGVPVALDTGDISLVDSHRDALGRHLAAGTVRHLFLHEADAAALTGLAAEAAAESLASSVGTVVLKRGEQGYLVQEGRNGTLVPREGTRFVDPTGAGDGFQAGYFWGRARGWSATEACRAGSTVAACVVEQPGTHVDSDRWARLVDELGRLRQKT